jgi:parvulin-like peptidyl-prolyl isomerase
MRAAHVLVQWAGSKDSKQSRTKADALTRAKEAKARIDAGEDFAAVALSYDDDGARTRGGDLGAFTPGTFPKSFESAVAKLDVGGVSDIVETSFGYHIIKRLP